MKTALTTATLILMCCASGANAESMKVPVGQQGTDQAVNRPARGITMAQVEQRFGAPEQRSASIGDPPITRWVYGQYTVYFEADHVIHSVLHPDNR